MEPDQHKWCDTVAWYLRDIRPLILTNPKTGEISPSPWLVPMLSDPARPCPYETFHLWFVKIMRDVVKVPCLPHNFRHGQASLLYHKYPDRLPWIARRLGDTEATVVQLLRLGSQQEGHGGGPKAHRRPYRNIGSRSSCERIFAVARLCGWATNWPPFAAASRVR